MSGFPWDPGYKRRRVLGVGAPLGDELSESGDDEREEDDRPALSGAFAIGSGAFAIIDPSRGFQPAAGEGTSTARTADAMESFTSWVPPWSRPEAVEPEETPEEAPAPAAVDEPVVPEAAAAEEEPEGTPSQFAPDDSGVGRFAYGDADGLPNPDDFVPDIDDDRLRGALESILLVVDNPVDAVVLAQVMEEPTSRIEAMLATMKLEYARPGSGIDLRQVAGGWRLYTRPEYAAYVERFVLDGQQIRLTQAALETLAVVAYKQPVTRSRVSAIRGVNCDGVIKTLVTRGLVEECGTEKDGAHLYRTTQLFLEKLGINSVDDLPSLAQYLPENLDEIDLAQR